MFGLDIVYLQLLTVYSFAINSHTNRPFQLPFFSSWVSRLPVDSHSPFIFILSVFMDRPKLFILS